MRAVYACGGTETGGARRNLPDSIDSAVNVPQELPFEETDLDDIEVLSESDGGDATQRQRHREHSHRGRHRHRHETSKKRARRASRHTGGDIPEDKSEERKRQGSENEDEESEGEEDEEGPQFDTAEEDIELGRRNRG